MIELQGGKLWRFDVNRRVTVVTNCSQVHFSSGSSAVALVTAVETAQNGTKSAAIPNQLLLKAEPLRAWTCENGCTNKEFIFEVHDRSKPTNYIYEPTRVESYEEIKRLVEEAAEAAEEAADAARAAAESVTPTLGHALEYDEQGRLAVDVATEATADNTLPITSAAVAATVGNIDALLRTI